MAQPTLPTNKFTEQQILNMLYDATANKLRHTADTSGSVGAPTNLFSEQEIFNKIFDETNNLIQLK